MGKKRTWQELPLDRIQAGAGCRSADDSAALDFLAQSIKAHGLQQPILVQPAGDGWTCFVGNRRLQAARVAGLAVVPCLIVDGELDQADIIEAQLLENLHRRDLEPMEQARAFQELMRLRSCSQRELARRLCINPGTISRALSLLELAPQVQELIEGERLAPSTALTLAHEPPDVQAEEGQRLAETGATREEAKRRLKPQPKTFDLETPGGWSVTVTAKRAKASRAELLTELAGLVDALRGQQQDGPRLAA